MASDLELGRGLLAVSIKDADDVIDPDAFSVIFGSAGNGLSSGESCRASSLTLEIVGGGFEACAHIGVDGLLC